MVTGGRTAESWYLPRLRFSHAPLRLRSMFRLRMLLGYAVGHNTVFATTRQHLLDIPTILKTWLKKTASRIDGTITPTIHHRVHAWHCTRPILSTQWRELGSLKATVGLGSPLSTRDHRRGLSTTTSLTRSPKLNSVLIYSSVVHSSTSPIDLRLHL